MKKGFTLVELIAVIAILGLLITIAVPSVLKVSKNIRKNMYCTKVEVIEKAAALYGEDNNLTGSCVVGGTTYNECNTITVQTLLDQDYIKADEVESGTEKIVNPMDKYSMNTDQVKVYKKNNRIHASVVLDAGVTCN